eukprot:TRINITY_DN53751_c0_g1_i1.p1 TRINITY_DN53751_c0_g1~~TRINITY_DN53751_c0_g1_i1.p1  ORF type:complete len:107 (-),score=10.25 TRINITY_DN53751_c0_g1_i1:120-440(-)
MTQDTNPPSPTYQSVTYDNLLTATLSNLGNERDKGPNPTNNPQNWTRITSPTLKFEPNPLLNPSPPKADSRVLLVNQLAGHFSFLLHAEPHTASNERKVVSAALAS